MGEGKRGLVVGVVDAMLDVASKGLGFLGLGVSKEPEGLVGCMWGCSGKLQKMVTEWDIPKSSEVVAEAATGFVVAGLAAGCCECHLRASAVVRCLWPGSTLLSSP